MHIKFLKKVYLATKKDKKKKWGGTSLGVRVVVGIQFVVVLGQ